MVVYLPDNAFLVLLSLHAFACVLFVYFSLVNVDTMHLIMKYIYNSIPDPILYTFLIYHDDPYNFIDNIGICKEFRIDNYYTIINVFNTRGVSVYEPVWNLFKCIQTLYFDNNAHYIRVVSLLTHLLNGFLLYWYSTLILRKRTQTHMKLEPEPRPVLLLLCLVFVVHPLNDSVVGWVSAQGYVLALTFGLLSSILLEVSISKWDQKELVCAYMWLVVSLVAYGFAVMVSVVS